MYSSLVAVLLLTSAANGSGGLGAVGAGKGVGWGGVGWGNVSIGLYMFPPQVHKCPSQATHVHNLT